MEPRHLRYFVAVAEDLSITKAAQKLRLAQPSLTRQIRNLENKIGVRLIIRFDPSIVTEQQFDDAIIPAGFETSGFHIAAQSESASEGVL